MLLSLSFFISLQIYMNNNSVSYLILLTDLSSMSEQKKQGLSQLASMLELYLQQELPDLRQESALLPSCREPLSLLAKVCWIHFIVMYMFLLLCVQCISISTTVLFCTCEYTFVYKWASLLWRRKQTKQLFIALSIPFCIWTVFNTDLGWFSQRLWLCVFVSL